MLFRLITYFRLKKGKEDPKRINERFGHTSNEALQKLEEYKQFCRNNNLPVKVVWLHAVSVGESLSVVNFVQKLSERNYFIVFTTMTKTSANILENKLPQNAVHQYKPWQTKKYLTKFLSTWKPSFVFFVESEIFPKTVNVLYKSKIPLYLINARLSDKSFRMWKIVKFYIKNLLKKYSYIFPLNEEEANKFKILSNNQVKIKCCGNLKFDTAIINKNAIEELFNKDSSPDITKCKLIKKISENKKKIIVFGSIHETEFFYILCQYAMLLKKLDCIGIFVPRYIEQSNILENKAINSNFNPIYWDKFTDYNSENIIIVNKMNILQKLYKICDIAVIGGSFVDKIGGHNPLESIVFSKPTFIGRYCHKSQNLINELSKNGAIQQTSNLSENILAFLRNEIENQSKLEKNINTFLNKHKNVANSIINELKL